MNLEELKKLIDIKEMYQLNAVILENIFEEEKRRTLFDRILASGADLERDFLRDIYQEEGSARKSFKQDYSPDSICELFASLSQEKESVFDECSGTGSLLIPFINRGVKRVSCIELSGNVLPILLFNLSIRNVDGTVIQGNVVTSEIMKVYELTRGEKYSDITIRESANQSKYKSIISNPPYSLAWDGHWDLRLFGFEVPPKSKADYLFVLDILSKLDEGGEAFVLLPHGVLFRGQAEEKIRRELIERGHLDALIGLPSNMFLNTTIPTVMLHIVKDEQAKRDLFIMDASKLGEKRGKEVILSSDTIDKISRLFKTKGTEDKLCRVVPYDEVVKNGFNLNIPRYIDTSEPEELPNLAEVVKDIIQIDEDIKKTEKELASIMSQLIGEGYQEKIGGVLDIWQS